MRYNLVFFFKYKRNQQLISFDFYSQCKARFLDFPFFFFARADSKRICVLFISFLLQSLGEALGKKKLLIKTHSANSGRKHRAQAGKKMSPYPNWVSMRLNQHGGWWITDAQHFIAYCRDDPSLPPFPAQNLDWLSCPSCRVLSASAWAPPSAPWRELTLATAFHCHRCCSSPPLAGLTFFLAIVCSGPRRRRWRKSAFAKFSVHKLLKLVFCAKW